MTKWIVCAVAALGIGFHAKHLAYAQHSQEVKQTREATHNELKKIAMLIDATPEQIEKVVELRTKYEKSKADAKKGGEAPFKMKNLRADSEKSLAQILNKDQMKTLRSHNLVGVVLGDQDGDPWQILSKLDLSPEQATQIKQIIADTMSTMESIKQDRSLSREQAEMKMRMLHEGAMQRVHEILTPDQIKQLKNMHSGSDSKVPPPHN
jgi:Spy/CpxP family protein refolding chaperone